MKLSLIKYLKTTAPWQRGTQQPSLPKFLKSGTQPWVFWRKYVLTVKVFLGSIRESSHAPGRETGSPIVHSMKARQEEIRKWEDGGGLKTG